MSSKFESSTIIASNVDELVQLGIRHIQENGEEFGARAGSGVQAYGTTYVLEDNLARVHTLRAPKSVQYLGRELLAYFRGSLSVEDGLAQASPFWRSLCDTQGNINSNYGYYIFHQQTEAGITQLDWVRKCFTDNRNSRKAYIGINGLQHKTETLDFPCTIGLQFHLRGNTMNCDVASRSTDVITGLPYDIAFFSLVNEVVAGLVATDRGEDITPGYTAMKTNFTQIYNKTRGKIPEILEGSIDFDNQRMPAIANPLETLQDILHVSKRPANTEMVQWVVAKAAMKANQL